MSATATLLAHCGAEKLTREELALVPCPEGTATHRPIAHHLIVDELKETLAFRQINVVNEEYAVTSDGQKMFGTMTLSSGADGIRFALGLRNSHNKSLALGLTVGFRVIVCDNLAFHGDYTPILRKHTRNVNLPQMISMGVDQCQRSFKPMVETVEKWKTTTMTDVQAKRWIYKAFVEEQLDAPLRLAKAVHSNYFKPPYPEFEPRTTWSLQNSFTEAFKELDPVPFHRSTAALAKFMETHEL